MLILTTSENGFRANADFVDYRSKRLIHVDGVYWHGQQAVRLRDRRLDHWCLENGWRFIRLTDTWIEANQKTAERVISRFIEGSITALVC